MRRYAEATPCPAPHPSYHSHRQSEYGRRSSIYAPGFSTDDTTANLEYTTEFQANLRQAKPRRPMRAARKQPAFNPDLDIFEDVAQEEEQQVQQEALETKRRSRTSIMPRGATEKRSTILAHPAQRMPVQEHLVMKPQRRRVSQLLVDRNDSATVRLQEDVLDKRDSKRENLKKDPRRRTIYVPSEDTTIMTIHPGQPTHKSRNPRAKSPDIGLDLVTLSEEESENLVSALKKKPPRKSLAVPPKRAPLQQSHRSHQGVTTSEDRFGKGNGKENVPPGIDIFLDFSKDVKEEIKKPVTKAPRVHFKPPRAPETLARKKSLSESTQKRPRSETSSDGHPVKSIKAKADGSAGTTRRVTTARLSTKMVTKARVPRADRAPLSSSPFHMDKSPPNALRRQRTERATSTITMMHEVGRPQQAREAYPVLSEDLARPELYEDNWLTYQEVAITQLLNSLFDSAKSTTDADDNTNNLRSKMLALYHEPSVPVLHKRLQASLLYGALSIPKDLLAQTIRLKDDVGMRKKFLNLWVKTYDLPALRAAAETVIGRQLTVPCRLSSGSTSSDDGSRQFRSERRAIEAFLDAFLIRNEDAVRVKAGGGSIASIARAEQGDDFGSQGWGWRRTALRSLMLVLVLDRAKKADIVSGCLFQTTSPYKTSVDVLHHLASMLLPSHGDVTRPLGHFDYKVDHVQYPLQEYTYQIENIAIDLRDGVILTRLIELLLYSPSASASQQETITISLPSGELLTSILDVEQKENWVLSQHLKFPSIGRAQKLYNVQLGLSVLTGIRGIPIQAVGGIKAEDIVDGHREKTLSLLWSLVGKCGLATLVDWSHIVKEVNHFRDLWYRKRDNYAQRDLDSDDDEATTELEGLDYHKRLLLSWARSIARLQGLRVSNLTTSFSDPRVLEAIVDMYLPSALALTTGSTQLSLATKLRAAGCSTSFIALFAPNNMKARSIPSKDFTLLTLSFLASRLLPLSVKHRAAATIQQAYRRHLARREMHKRVMLMRVAADCAVVAQRREVLVNAAMVLQRRWKAILAQRTEQLTHDIELFQALARGWAIRRWVRRITGGRVGGKEKVRRIRGGW
ncbi:hypothetical protein BU24DRAFT_421415 [Aaosphaeria arxii CBS 175.79]|uniref:Calponin-homology (CH) domain-containing protein n=1 Tax=Aaosphaeria arxii CBS 175.79 TaxID=1450172 RepID=A0A6A5XZS5_9PLEO|nr:uncharacterized protein BU24DRAFT_421415 [Aaosphaeria arxii CBS 175.79]KAF2018423.1 hypothetical protein BU24DRAFT_421415 [Aaosphaeria arxii CBS 175.79]